MCRRRRASPRLQRDHYARPEPLENLGRIFRRRRRLPLDHDRDEIWLLHRPHLLYELRMARRRDRQHRADEAFARLSVSRSVVKVELLEGVQDASSRRRLERRSLSSPRWSMVTAYRFARSVRARLTWPAARTAASARTFQDLDL